VNTVMNCLVADCCEHCNELSGFIKGEEFLSASREGLLLHGVSYFIIIICHVHVPS
jgi:hypothetical protein